MPEFYATLHVTSDDDVQEFQTDLARNNVSIKQCTEESESCFHYCLQGDWDGYQYVIKIQENVDCRYTLTNVEHFEK